MNRYVFATGLLIATFSGAHAQDAPRDRAVPSPPSTAIPPPPDINDPGVRPAPAPNARPAPAASGIPALPALQDNGAVAPPEDARGEAPPQVTVRTQGSDRVEEYRHGGQVYMIRIIPRHGPVQTYIDTDGDGRLERGPSATPVAPVYYTLYEWD